MPRGMVLLSRVAERSSGQSQFFRGAPTFRTLQPDTDVDVASVRSENEYPCPSFAIEPARFLVLTATILLLHVLSLNEASEGSPGYYRYPAIHGDTMSHCNFAVNPRVEFREPYLDSWRLERDYFYHHDQ